MGLTKQNENCKLEQVYMMYRKRMYIAACKVLKNPQSAEDAVHDAFIAIARNIDKIDDVNSVQTASYVIKAARNTALNMISKDCSSEVLYIDMLDISSDESLLERICEQEEMNVIVNAIMALDDKYKDVLSLYYLNELTVSEIADVLSRKLTTVKQQLVRGRRKLISNIKKEVTDNEK
ncbi:MAG: sigma-70 family RNA polymerase sigma factor [Faecalibacterium sp.]|nr:sigma-70 family RNA polymerase sigma factor [Ruminococcus sp.]MCM1391245.1 sigma-70 family RNA polymerase sigma factor [Ruminococcus sp.]MCM1484781.1 sigma-70 family RNA polymerase sigma factor [Faecalibacterium sp.]